MTPGHGGWQGCALEGSRVCARTSHTSPMYIVAACPVPSLPTRHLVFLRTPVLSLSLSPASPCVICPPWRVPRAVSSAPASRRPRSPRRLPARPQPCRPPAPPPQPRRPPAPPCRPPAPLSPTRPSSRRPSPTSLLGPPSPRHISSFD